MKIFIRRTQYLFYYFKKLDWPKFCNYFKYVKHHKGINAFFLLIDIISSTYRYNIGIIDYFIFRFYEKDLNERAKWVGTGYKYEYDLLMNPKPTRHIIENKIHFYRVYKPFIKHATCTIEDLKESRPEALSVLSNSSGKIVIKDALGQCGWDVEVIESINYTREKLIEQMQKKKFNLAEEFIIQHPELRRLSPSGLNTIRIITQLNAAGEVDFLGARLRISVDNHVDNLASGNIAAAVDLETGKVIGPGVFSDITRSSVTHHPVTGTEITGFQLPMWEKIVDICKRAALHRPENRSIGWDVALTSDGPEFLEGNHNWCKILWQLPVNQGLKYVLEKYLNE